MLKTCLKALRVLFEQIEIHGRRKHSGKKDVSIHEPPLEMGVINKLIEMFQILQNTTRSQAKRWNNQTDYPLGMPVIKESL